MKITMSRLYDNYATAEEVVEELENSGVPAADISLVASNADNWYTTDAGANPNDKTRTHKPDAVKAHSSGSTEGGAGLGAVIGGGAGLLAGLGMLAIPGIGPVVAAGWLVATAAGAAAGGAAGGAVGALMEGGVSTDEAPVYAEGLRRGGTVVTVRVEESDRARIEPILNRTAVDIRKRGDTYRSAGWSGFDDKAAPYTADQIRKERGASL